MGILNEEGEKTHANLPATVRTIQAGNNFRYEILLVPRRLFARPLLFCSVVVPPLGND